MIKVIAAAVVLIAAYQVVNLGLSRHERVECLQWQHDAQAYRLYTLANWQISQCQAHGINLTQ